MHVVPGFFMHSVTLLAECVVNARKINCVEFLVVYTADHVHVVNSIAQLQSLLSMNHILMLLVPSVFVCDTLWTRAIVERLRVA